MGKIDYNLLFTITKELCKIFEQKPSSLIYDSNSQYKSNVLLHSFASECGIYDVMERREEENINLGFTIIDRNTNKELSFIDVESMKERVESVLDTNNIYSCLKSLAVSNKCAHAFDADMQEHKANFINIYKEYYVENLRDVSFLRPFNKVCKKMKKINHDLITLVREIDFKKVYKSLRPDTKIKDIHTIKRFLDNDLKVPYYDDEHAQSLFDYYKANRNKLLEAYLYNEYSEGVKIVKIQNKMFAVKANYIAMIAQLLKNNTLKDIKYELVEAPTRPGFDNMLVIDDPSLSYYIEVHMPNFLATVLTKKYGFEVTKERTTLPLGSSAVYERDMEEVNLLKAVLNKGFLDEKNNKAETRAKIITRNLNEEEAYKFHEEDDYEFKTKKVKTPIISVIETFLKRHEIHLYDDILRFCSETQLNENYSIDVTKSIARNYHFSIYQAFENNEKSSFIEDALYHTGYRYDSFDKCLVEFSKGLYNQGDSNNNIIARLLIFKDELKEKYMKENKKLIKKTSMIY